MFSTRVARIWASARGVTRPSRVSRGKFRFRTLLAISGFIVVLAVPLAVGSHEQQNHHRTDGIGHGWAARHNSFNDKWYYDAVDRPWPRPEGRRALSLPEHPCALLRWPEFRR